MQLCLKVHVTPWYFRTIRGGLIIEDRCSPALDDVIWGLVTWPPVMAAREWKGARARASGRLASLEGILERVLFNSFQNKKSHCTCSHFQVCVAAAFDGYSTTFFLLTTKPVSCFCAQIPCALLMKSFRKRRDEPSKASSPSLFSSVSANIVDQYLWTSSKVTIFQTAAVWAKCWKKCQRFENSMFFLFLMDGKWNHIGYRNQLWLGLYSSTHSIIMYM